MLWIILCVLCFKGVHAGYRGTSITCVCSTVHCVENREQRCNTTGVCFSQYLDRQDGSHPVIRGCISSRTPLLCENRKPAIATGSPWPVLLCCNSNLCNRDAIPTAPSWQIKDTANNDTVLKHTDQNAEMLEASSNKDASVIKNFGVSSNSLSSDLPSSIHNPYKSSSSFPHIISPVYISVLILGIISLVIIGIVAAIVLRRSNHFYAEQYGALEHQHKQAYLKQGRTSYPTPVHVQSEYDSDEETLSQCSQLYVHVIDITRPPNDT